jgi:Skp family chaperone for outer membrane proteins
MDDLYGQIETVIREIAREKGLDIVLADEEIDLAKVANVQDIATLIRSNKILYHSVDIDITQEVLAELDASM